MADDEASDREPSPGESPAEAPPLPPAAPVPDYKDLFLRASAELDNYRKRVDREKVALQAFAAEGVVRRLLEPYDSFGRAIVDLVRVQADAPREMKASLSRSIDGLRALERQLRDLLAFEGVEMIDALGAEFDPAFHEALVRVPHARAPPGTIVEVLQPGYTMRGKLLRPARVAVAEGPAHKTAEAHGDAQEAPEGNAAGDREESHDHVDAASAGKAGKKNPKP